MSAGLRLAPGLTLPVEFATEGVAVIGMRGSGKSNTEVRFAELLSAAKVPFCAVDPKGDWHGVRASADGKHPGLPVPVFGGLHGDFPLEPSMGARIADLLVDEMLSAVLDVSAMSKTGGLPTFLTAFCNQLMHRHQLEPHVRTVILEEAHRYIPQEVRASGAALKEAAASLLLEGRAFGLGCWAATQRPARLHKDVLEEVGTAIIHRIGVSATNDMRTITGWVKHYELSPSIVASLTSLSAGEAWVLIPDLGIVKRVQVDRRKTFDSAATPKVGAARRAPTNVADIDADAILLALAEVVERAKANDPAELKRRVRELEAELRKQPTEVVVEHVPTVPAWAIEDARERLADHDRMLALLTSLREPLALLHKRLLDEYDGVITAHADKVRVERRGSEPARAKGSTAPEPVAAPPAAPPPNRNMITVEGTIGASARRLLMILAQHPDGITKARAAALGGWSPRKSTIRNAISELRSRGLAEAGEPYRPTALGVEYVGDELEPLPTGAALLAHYRDKIGAGVTRQLFDALVHAWPGELDRDTAAMRAGVDDPNKSTLRNAMSTLRTLGLVDRHGFRASDDVMEAIRG